MADKVVSVPGQGLMSFPGDIPDQHIGSAIQQHLQSLGSANLAAAPASMQRLTSNLGVQFVPHDGNVVSASRGGVATTAIAGVRPNDPNTIQVIDPQAFVDPQYAIHEAAHLIQNNLPGPLQAAIPPDRRSDPYDYGGPSGLAALRAKGGTIASLPREQWAAVGQNLAAARKTYADAVANKTVTPALRAQTQEMERTHAPFMNDYNSLPQSVVQMTAPGAQGINTTPRTPLPPPEYYSSLPEMRGR